MIKKECCGSCMVDELWAYSLSEEEEDNPCLYFLLGVCDIRLENMKTLEAILLDGE